MEIKQVINIASENYRNALNGLALLNLNSKPQFVDSAETVPKTKTDGKGSIKTSHTNCSTCKSSFSSKDALRQHFKEDWHRYNLKLSMKDREPLSEKQFEELEDDVSSISGSESDSFDDENENKDNDQPRKDARILFRNSDEQVISIFRCLVASKKDDSVENVSVERAVKLINNPNWLIMMCGGGHFAAAIFQNNEVILHKTFHTYTVRAKQGSSQSSKDNKGTHAKSAGASLRRYNEAVLSQDIHELLDSWSKEIESCDLIFYRAVGPSNKKILFSGKIAAFDKTDPRLRTIPFNTRRATLNEVKRVYNCLRTVYIYDLNQVQSTVAKPAVSAEQKCIEEEYSKPEDIDVDEVTANPENEDIDWVFGVQSRLKEVDPADDENVDQINADKNLFDQINNEQSSEGEEEELNEDEKIEYPSEPQTSERNQVKKKRKKKKKVKVEISDECASPETYLNCLFLSAIEHEDHFILDNCIAENLDNKILRKALNSYVDKDKNTLLHLAAKKGFLHHVRVLLEAGASPCYKNRTAHTAYDVSANKDTRDTFRRFYAEFPDKYDYQNSHIPKPLSDDLVKAQLEKKREKNRKMKQKLKEKKIKEKEEEEKLRFLQLSDREKRALAAERRILAQQAESEGKAMTIVTSRCFACGSDMTGVIPFEYENYKFCSMSCLKVHRSKKSNPS